MTRTLDAIEAKFGHELAFDVDYYWNVPLTQAYRLDLEPDLDMGQVSDDSKSVGDLAASTDEIAIWHECQHLAGVLRAIAQEDIELPRLNS